MEASEAHEMRCLHQVAPRKRARRPSPALVALLALIGAPMMLLAQTSRARRLETSEIVAMAMPATVTIISLGARGDTIGQGSGFAIRDDGVIVTNFHVLRGASSAVVVLASGERFTRVRVLDADSLVDLAVLKVPGAGMATLASRTTIPRAGERVVAIGSPLGLARTVTDGILSATRVMDGRELVQITAPISPGSSGGAVLDATGRVFAVSTLYLKTGQSLNFAVPVRYALGMLNDLPTERTIAAVFATLDSPPNNGAAASATGAGTGSRADPGLTRHPHPRASVDGTYSISQVWYNASGAKTLEQIGFVFATDHIGYLILASKLPDNQRGPTSVYAVSRWRTNERGDVILAAGGVTYDGFQTADNGFLAGANMVRGADSAVKAIIGGVPANLPLSRNDGLLDVQWRSQWVQDNHKAPNPVDWTGEAAVAFARDTIYVTLYLTNKQGGTTQFRSRGPLTDHSRFELAQDNGSTLRGSVRDGRLSAELFDKRDNGAAFIGNVQADRH